LLASDATTATQKAVQEKPDLILLDIGLPDQNGFLVLDHLKRNPDLASIPVIIVSARPSDVYKDAAVMAGARAYFEKPFNNEELLHAIRNALTPSYASP
jgi:DNA-binding response OmpR family regulator